MTMDAVLIPAWTWVEPIGSDGYRLGVTCAINQGGAVEEIGRSGDLVLVRYRRPGQYGRSRGTECQDGQVFFLGADDFDSMTERYAEIRKRQDAAAATARKILGAEHE